MEVLQSIADFSVHPSDYFTLRSVCTSTSYLSPIVYVSADVFVGTLIEINAKLKKCHDPTNPPRVLRESLRRLNLLEKPDDIIIDYLLDHKMYMHLYRCVVQNQIDEIIWSRLPPHGNEQALQWGIRNEDIEMVKYFINRGADVYWRNNSLDKSNAINLAIASNDYGIITLVFQRVTFPHEDDKGQNYLTQAVEVGSVTACQLLLGKGVKPLDGIDIAIKHGHTALVGFLYRNGSRMGA